MASDLRVCSLDRPRGRRYLSPRSEEPKGSEGKGPEGDPWESRKANWAHLLYR